MAKELTSVRIFISYAHRDEGWLARLRKHLAPLEHAGVIQVFDDRDIEPGVPWDGEIKRKVESADLILLLVSPDFLSSRYCNEVEVKRAIERHDARVVPIALRPCDWRETLFLSLQALPRNLHPIVDWKNPDMALKEIAGAIHETVASIKQSRQHYTTPADDLREAKPRTVACTSDANVLGAVCEFPPRSETPANGNATEEVLSPPPEPNRCLEQPISIIDRQMEIAVAGITNTMKRYIPDFDERFPSNIDAKLFAELRSEHLFQIHTARALVFGRTGVGKTTSINSLMNERMFPTSGELTCTRTINVVEHRSGLIFYDTPGIEDLPYEANVARTALGLAQTKDEPAQTVSIVDITRNHAEGPATYTLITVDDILTERNNHVEPDWFERHSERIRFKKVAADELRVWVRRKFAFLVYVCDTGTGFSYPHAKLLKEVAETHGEGTKIFKVLNCRKEHEATGESDVELKQAIERSAKWNVPEPDAWLRINASDPGAIEALVRAFADSLTPEVLRSVNGAIRRDFAHLIEDRLSAMFLDYVANVAALMAVFPADYTVKGQNFIRFAIKSVVTMAEFLLSRLATRVDAAILDKLMDVKAFRSRKLRSVSPEIMVTKPFRHWLNEWFGFSFQETTEEVGGSTYYAIGGIDAVQIAMAMGLCMIAVQQYGGQRVDREQLRGMLNNASRIAERVLASAARNEITRLTGAAGRAGDEGRRLKIAATLQVKVRELMNYGAAELSRSSY